MIASDMGFIAPDDLDTYKKEHISDIIKELNKLADGKFEISASDIEFKETEDEIIE
jgi:hypothetical protein